MLCARSVLVVNICALFAVSSVEAGRLTSFFTAFSKASNSEDPSTRTSISSVESFSDSDDEERVDSKPVFSRRSNKYLFKDDRSLKPDFSVVKTWESDTLLSNKIVQIRASSGYEIADGCAEMQRIAVLDFDLLADSSVAFTQVSSTTLWPNVRRYIAQCFKLLLMLEKRLLREYQFYHVSDDRMPGRAVETATMLDNWQSFKKGYMGACALFAQYLATASTLGFGTRTECVMDEKDTAKQVVSSPLSFQLSNCVACNNSNEDVEQTTCEKCGVGMVMIPDDVADLTEFGRDMYVLLLQLQALKRALKALITQMSYSLSM